MSLANERTDEGSGGRFLGWGLGLLIAPWLLLGVTVLFIRDGVPESALWMLYASLAGAALVSLGGAALVVAAAVLFASNSGANRRL